MLFSGGVNFIACSRRLTSEGGAKKTEQEKQRKGASISRHFSLKIVPTANQLHVSLEGLQLS